MQYHEAFRALGYRLDAIRTDWSAANATGVCLSLWRKEIAMDHGAPFFDSRVHADPIEVWGDKPGARRRLEHLKAAEDEFDRWLDVVLRAGGYHDGPSQPSEPWIVAERQNHKWRLTFLDRETGHFACRAEPLAP